eukprot:scaffold5829_cov157-Isochrysis_galbana.AAC.1
MATTSSQQLIYTVNTQCRQRQPVMDSDRHSWSPADTRSYSTGGHRPQSSHWRLADGDWLMTTPSPAPFHPFNHEGTPRVQCTPDLHSFAPSEPTVHQAYTSLPPPSPLRQPQN